MEKEARLIPTFPNNTLFKINLHFDVMKEHLLLTVFSINRCIIMNTVKGGGGRERETVTYISTSINLKQ